MRECANVNVIIMLDSRTLIEMSIFGIRVYLSIHKLLS